MTRVWKIVDFVNKIECLWWIHVSLVGRLICRIWQKVTHFQPKIRGRLIRRFDLYPRNKVRVPLTKYVWPSDNIFEGFGTCTCMEHLSREIRVWVIKLWYMLSHSSLSSQSLDKYLSNYVIPEKNPYPTKEDILLGNTTPRKTQEFPNWAHIFFYKTWPLRPPPPPKPTPLLPFP